jgi:hypothetical protein
MDDHGGLQAHLATLRAGIARRRFLQGAAAFGAACATETSLSGSSGDTGTGACEAIPEETEGPYPGDGTNGPLRSRSFPCRA